LLGKQIFISQNALNQQKGPPMFRPLLVTAALCFGSAAFADDFTRYATNDSFDDATFAVESAIVSAGLVIDNVSHTGDMLERTRGVTGSDVVLFKGADVFSFCSASVSRQVMEADPENFNYCPYAIRVYEIADGSGKVTVSHQTYSGTMAPVQALLENIVKAALDLK